MAETSDWVTPRLYGRPWFEKPPLLYWGGAIFFKLMPSQPEIAARLPSAISALLATLALAWLAWRTYGEECARWLLLLLPTSVGMIGFSHACATDMPFAGMLTMALVCAAVVLGLARSPDDTPILPNTPWLALLLFGFFMGLAVLAKGPAALILMGGAVFFWALFTKRWRDASRLLHPAAIATFCATALPWYILCARRNPDFFRVFIIEHNFKRYLTPEFQHIQPFWFYVPILLIAFLPWSFLLIWAAMSRSREYVKIKSVHPLSLLLLALAIFGLLFFSISRSKLPGYILPCVPAAGLLVARGVQNYKLTYRSSFIGFALAGAVQFFVLTGLGILVLSGRTSLRITRTEGETMILALISLCFAFSNLFLVFVRWWRKSPAQIALPPLAAPPVLIAVFLSHFSLTALLAPDHSGRMLSRELRSQTVERQDLFVAEVSRGMHFSLNFYLRKEVPTWTSEDPRPGLVLTQSTKCPLKMPASLACSKELYEFYLSGFWGHEIKLDSSLGGNGGGRKPE